jgi:hypothetical protein
MFEHYGTNVKNITWIRKARKVKSTQLAGPETVALLSGEIFFELVQILTSLFIFVCVQVERKRKFYIIFANKRMLGFHRSTCLY